MRDNDTRDNIVTWTAENDSNTLRVDAKIFASAKRYLRKKKFPDTCGHGLGRQL